jgi:hypothetical protein
VILVYPEVMGCQAVFDVIMVTAGRGGTMHPFIVTGKLSTNTKPREQT